MKQVVYLTCIGNVLYLKDHELYLWSSGILSQWELRDHFVQSLIKILAFHKPGQQLLIHHWKILFDMHAAQTSINQKTVNDIIQ